MLHAGLDLSRRRLDVCLLSDHAELLEQTAAPPDADGLRGLVARVARYRQPVRAVIESMNGARFVHDTLEEHGWEVLVADAQKVKGLAPLACKTDRIDARVLAVLSERDLVPAIWLPDPSIRRERELARFRLHLVRHRTTLKNRIHATLITFGHPCPVSDLRSRSETCRRPVTASKRLLRAVRSLSVLGSPSLGATPRAPAGSSASILAGASVRRTARLAPPSDDPTDGHPPDRTP
jgi:transposase